MISLFDSQDSRVNTTGTIKRLARAIMVSQGQFSLVLACCNSTTKQQQILRSLKEFATVDIQQIALPPSAQTLYTTLKNLLGSTQPKALLVKGLESVDALNQVIISTNLMRDEFKKQFEFPVVLWVNDEILRKLIWLAPDLKNWAACTIRFDAQPNQQFIKKQVVCLTGSAMSYQLSVNSSQ
ncbi:hypothetical protein G7B40_033760 [Aetokthonos hydrillicola Thurmond2011]|jgi:coenzyme F420-reducing hydrogenase gamma subunit|uniref:WD-repeat protein n=1 Tax=Aetokthonos hydrillicola Thurmond2011 TaxID=2712845 RepID=A0AAP5IDZ2_9CYAN|nr:hypothetical protein [Aetokthonos hydrillicola]MBO3459718.1 hypothetical protein [Aetokthonos hydrillicola CCALA 1050]MBW4585150.1 hypothetical protein [Aetokthonos hydrillicola CCALA 1050]MDR9899489.1 hypothetical protein [Aetokthonos hydrillicola Thurmond2011]